MDYYELLSKVTGLEADYLKLADEVKLISPSEAVSAIRHVVKNLNIPCVSISLPEILRALDTTECELLPSEWIKNEPNNVNYMGGFLTGVRWRERQ